MPDDLDRILRGFCPDCRKPYGLAWPWGRPDALHACPWCGRETRTRELLDQRRDAAGQVDVFAVADQLEALDNNRAGPGQPIAIARPLRREWKEPEADRQRRRDELRADLERWAVEDAEKADRKAARAEKRMRWRVLDGGKDDDAPAT